MPLYEYRCTNCQAVTSYLRPVARRNEPAVCPDCGEPAECIFSIPQKPVVVNMTANQILHDPEVWK